MLSFSLFLGEPYFGSNSVSPFYYIFLASL
jgi:hypothetical protein